MYGGLNVNLLLPVVRLGSAAIDLVSGLGRWGLFVYDSVTGIFTPPFRFHSIVREIFRIGVQSISIITMTGLFTGMVLAVQGYHTLKRFGSEDALGSGVIYTLLTELGPVLSALLLTGRAGSSLCAEIGVMRTSAQIDQLKCMAINVFNFLISPKLLAGLIAMPVLTFLFVLVGVLGGYLAGSVILGVDSSSFFNSMPASIDDVTLRMSFVKSLLFAFLIVNISAYRGYTVHLQKEKGSAAVSKSTTEAVIISSVSILLWDYLLTSLLI